MPKVNFEAQITDLKDQPVKLGDGFMTLGDVAANALLTPDPKDDGKKKMLAFELAIKCKGEADLTIEEMAKVKESIGKTYPPLVVGRAWNLLEKGTSNGQAEAKA